MAKKIGLISNKNGEVMKFLYNEIPANDYSMRGIVVKKIIAKKQYKKGDICWNCGKVMKDPKKHYPINSTMFCGE